MLNEESINKIIALSETTKVSPDHLKNFLESFKINQKWIIFSNFESINTLVVEMTVAQSLEMVTNANTMILKNEQSYKHLF